MVDQQTILDTARYLRGVRPLDPAELETYTEEHPGVITQVLREHALELGIVEQSDGTFIPVPEDPIPPTEGSIERLPAHYDRRLLDRLTDRYGVEWASGESGRRLRDRITQLKDAYYRQQPVEYDAVAVDGYAIYHLADYYAAMGYVLRELTSRGLVDRTLRVLDIGAGVGGPAVAVFDTLPEQALVEYHAVEPSDPAASFLSWLLDPIGPNRYPTIHRTTAESFAPTQEYDLIVFANVLSELADPTAVVTQYTNALADDGTIVLLSPADRNTAQTHRRVERAVVDDPDGPSLTVYSPTLRLWPDRQPTDSGWSFAEAPELAVPEVQQQLQAAAPENEGTFTNTTVKYTYTLLRTDGTRRVDVSPDPKRWAPLATSEQHVSKRIDIVVVKLSADLGTADNPLFRIGDGSQSTDHFAVLAKETGLNRTLLEAPYGAVLAIEAGLMLWNDDEEAYNVVIDDQSVVDLIGA